jgi:predicted nucleic acid-binding protein
MEALTFLTDLSAPLVADTSVVINLIATGCAPAIVRALPGRLVVVDAVPAELDMGRRSGRHNADRLNELVDAKLVEIVSLGDVATQHFSALVIGSAATTLDDGEAATIAYAVEQAGTAFIDERKAIRICEDRYPELRVGCTVDILVHPDVQCHLGTEALAVGIFNALQSGRMRVLPHHLEQVVGLIGYERAASCHSLPRSIRLSPQNSANASVLKRARQ